MNAHVKKINFEKNKAIGISYWKGSQLKEVKSNNEILLCAGSIGSPHILKVSGIGDSSK